MVDIKVPDLPESVDEASLLLWEKATGDVVERNEKLADVETDKVVLEVFATSAGVLTIVAEEGAILRRGDVVCSIEASGEAAASAKPTAKKDSDAPPASDDALALSPSVRKLLNEHNLDPANVAGTGKDGRITPEDVAAAPNKSSGSNTASVPPAPAPRSQPPSLR